MDAPPAPPDTSLRLPRSWLNTGRDGEAYWSTAADYLAELRARTGEYERKARRRQRLTFDEARNLRRLLACLADAEAGREGLSTADRNALEDAGGRLRQALADLAKLEGLDPVPLLGEAGKRLSVAWAGFLALCAKGIDQQEYASIIEDAHYYTAKAKAKARLTPDEVDTIRGTLFRRMSWEVRAGRPDGDGRTPDMMRDMDYCHGRLERALPLLASRFGLSSKGWAADAFNGGGFWYEFHQRAEEAMKKSNEQPGEDTLEQAIRTLLRSVPEAWAEYDPAVMTEPRERALFLLVAAGMVERRSSFRLRMFGHPVAVEATFTVTGEYGGVEALERVAAGVWDQWRDAWQERTTGPAKDAPAFHCERIGREQWRLTADGIQARANLETEAAVVFDFVLKRGFFDGRPRQMPDGRISQRLPVRGKGALEKMELVKADAPGAGPAGVSIANWADGGKAFADAFAAAFASIQAKGNPPAIAHAPTSTKPTATYTVAAVLEMAGVSDTTLNRYAKLAGIKTPQRGKRNHRYSADEVRAMLQAIIDNTSDRAMKERCAAALAKL